MIQILLETSSPQSISQYCANIFWPVGREVAGKTLCRALVDESALESIETMSDTAILGTYDRDGYDLELRVANYGNFQRYMKSHKIHTGNSEVDYDPPENQLAGWELPKWSKRT